MAFFKIGLLLVAFCARAALAADIAKIETMIEDLQKTVSEKRGEYTQEEIDSLERHIKTALAASKYQEKSPFEESQCIAFLESRNYLHANELRWCKQLNEQNFPCFRSLIIGKMNPYESTKVCLEMSDEQIRCTIDYVKRGFRGSDAWQLCVYGA